MVQTAQTMHLARACLGQSELYATDGGDADAQIDFDRESCACFLVGIDSLCESKYVQSKNLP